MNQRSKVYDELKNKHLKQTGQTAPNVLQPTPSSPFLLSSGPVTGSNTPAPILPNQASTSVFPTLEVMTPAQKAVANAHNITFGFYAPQDSSHNPILPVLPRYM